MCAAVPSNCCIQYCGSVRSMGKDNNYATGPCAWPGCQGDACASVNTLLQHLCNWAVYVHMSRQATAGACWYNKQGCAPGRVISEQRMRVTDSDAAVQEAAGHIATYSRIVQLCCAVSPHRCSYIQTVATALAHPSASNLVATQTATNSCLFWGMSLFGCAPPVVTHNRAHQRAPRAIS